MSPRHTVNELPKDLVSLVVEVMDKLSLVELNKLLLFTELEINYREDNGLLDND